MGKNGGSLAMDLDGYSGKTITEEYIEQFGIEAFAEFNKETYIKVHGIEKYMQAFGKLEEHRLEGTWEPCHKHMLGNGIVGIENLGGDLDKVVGKRFKFMAFPIRWWLGDGSMVRCVAEIDEDDLNDAPDRIYPFGAI
jgi:kynurenine formamidase